jgi:hypothetical protein
MAARKKAKSSRRAKPKKSKRIAKRVVAAKKSAKKVTGRKTVARKRAAPKRAKRAAKQPQRSTQIPATETVVVDTIEQPAPGVVVVTEAEYTVRTDEA